MSRALIAFLFLFSSSIPVFAQSGNEPGDTVTFTARFEKANATKDGYHVNDFVVNISDSLARVLDKKVIAVTGKVSVVPGLNHTPKEYDKDGNEIIMQGRAEDSKHIYNPVIEIIK